MKKLLLVLMVVGLIACLFAGCIPGVVPGEGEGEGEPEETTRVVMVELFIADGCGGCVNWAEPAMEQLAQEYGPTGVLFLEEYAWLKYSTTETVNRYKWYVSDRGTPDAFFNGLNQRIHGASSTMYEDYKSAIEAELAKEAKIYISASKTDESSTTITITGNIQNISSGTLSNLLINGMIYEDRGSKGLRYLVLDIFDGQEVSSISPGETVEFSFTSENLDWEDSSKVHGVIFVQAPNSPTKEILQAKYVEDSLEE